MVCVVRFHRFISIVFVVSVVFANGFNGFYLWFQSFSTLVSIVYELWFQSFLAFVMLKIASYHRKKIAIPMWGNFVVFIGIYLVYLWNK